MAAADISNANLEISKQPNMEAVIDSNETVLMDESERSDSKQNLKSVEAEKEENRGVPTNADGAESPSRFHEWFAALNAEDRSAAASFTDAAFWGVFWEYAAPSWSSFTSKSSGSHSRTGTFHYGGTSIVTGDGRTDDERSSLKRRIGRSSVSTRSIASRCCRHSSSCVYIPAFSHVFVLSFFPNKDLVSSLDWKAMVPLQDFVARYEAWDEDGHTQTESSIGQKKEEAKTNLNDIEENIANAKSESTALRIENDSDVLNGTVVILPASVHRFTNQKINGPVVTLQPSVWGKHQEQDWEIANNLRGIASTTTKTEWILRLNNGSDRQLVPLSSLLIARFQWAISNAYLKYERRRHATAVDDISLVTKEVFSHCQGVKDIMMVMESSSLSTFLEPLVDVCFGSNNCHPNSGSISFESAILTPLHWLVHYYVHQKKQAFKWCELDQAVGASLTRMTEHCSTPALRCMTDKNDGSGESQPDITDHPINTMKSSEEGASGQNKKKKKKTKKRKVCFLTSML